MPADRLAAYPTSKPGKTVRHTTCVYIPTDTDDVGSPIRRMWSVTVAIDVHGVEAHSRVMRQPLAMLLDILKHQAQLKNERIAERVSERTIQSPVNRTPPRKPRSTKGCE